MVEVILLLEKQPSFLHLLAMHKGRSCEVSQLCTFTLWHRHLVLSKQYFHLSKTATKTTQKRPGQIYNTRQAFLKRKRLHNQFLYRRYLQVPLPTSPNWLSPSFLT